MSLDQVLFLPDEFFRNNDIFQKKKDSKQVVQQNTDSDMSYDDCKVNDQEKFLRVSKTYSNDQKQVQLKEGSNSSLTKNIIPDNSSKTSKEGNDSSRN